VISFHFFIAKKQLVRQSESDALMRMIEEGIKKGNAALVREAISLLEAQGHNCADAEDRLIELVRLHL